MPRQKVQKIVRACTIRLLTLDPACGKTPEKIKERFIMMREQLKAIREEAIKQIQDSGNLDKLNDVGWHFLEKRDS